MAFSSAFSLFLNVTSSVLLISINKVLLSKEGFMWTNTLCGLHFLTTAAVSRIFASEGRSSLARPIPASVLVIFTNVSVFSISLLTLSLKINSVGFYQLSKLVAVAVTCLFERFLFSKTFSSRTLGSIAVVLVGVASTIVGDVTLSLQGLITAALSVILSSAQQIGVAKIQKDYSLSANELVAAVFHWQALVLLVGGPVFDVLLFGSSPLSWDGFVLRDQRIAWLFGSCIAAVAVNYSQVCCVRSLSPTGFQVLGNAKNVFVLLVGSTFFDGSLPFRTLIGQAIAVFGMVLYTRSVQECKEQGQESPITLVEPRSTKQ